MHMVNQLKVVQGEGMLQMLLMLLMHDLTVTSRVNRERLASGDDDICDPVSFCCLWIWIKM